MQRRYNGWISPYTETRKSKVHGLGLFAKKPISKGTVVAAWGGHILEKKELKKLPKNIGDKYALEIYPGFYIVETKTSELDASDFINHSCDPNCSIKNTLLMVTKRPIRKNEELTADFSTPRGKKMRCMCGSKNCKKFVRF